MRTIGIVAAGAGVAIAALVGARTLPDLRRYLRIRKL